MANNKHFLKIRSPRGTIEAHGSGGLITLLVLAVIVAVCAAFGWLN